MKLRRKALLSALRAVRPALAEGTNQLEALSHVWFDGETVSAFDGSLGIQVALKTDFKGGVLGDKMLSIVDKSEATEFELTEGPDENLIMVGRNEKEETEQVKFALRSITEWFWAPPDIDVPVFELGEGFIDGVKSLMFSVGTSKESIPKERGVTIIQSNKSIDMCSTDRQTLSWVVLNTDHPVLTQSRSVIIPTLFCEQLTKFKEGSRLMVDTMTANLTGEIKLDDTESATVSMYGKLVEEDEPMELNTIAENFEVETAERIAIPSRMRSSLDQAVVLVGPGQALDMRVGADKEGNYITFAAHSPYGEFDDVIWFSGDHRKVKLKVDAALLRRGIEGRKELSVSERGIVATGPDNFVHVVVAK